ncbi:bacteriocin biosynthesis cyclodehydratase domain-containing protein [Microbacteriaceae bacterium SG_E_30_P1]|uniref:Bacteriocin biosynthesis cyclodehydratase domain-containing protein n=1 Tax=Antiquaquibacter oligotrophicus TaxID=2880260 RepID=A0ABT6KKB5_9MICO|nr:hypothetical protein [Antiquaquibacter oligotrophicus]MDH6180433.1 bacteriocin biosynthesis cyclodehydratase domain-containing protein [Antiquaquibacter oligotrophicus]UDF13829.1 hypothetical protein LH407_02950 [Antiquaquibacter oligotrophicus]
MTIRIDPRWPLVWRDPFTLQIGIDPPRVVLEHVTTLEERVISALRIGATRGGLVVVADGQTAVVESLLERLTPVLRAPSPQDRVWAVAVTGRGRFVELCSAVLADAGVRVLVAERALDLREEHVDLAVATGHGVLAPDAHSAWLRRDIPHLPVVFTDSAVHLGPFVEPGSGPCLVCVELHRRDADHAWPAIATQLLQQYAVRQPPVVVAEAAAECARLVLARVAGARSRGESLRISYTGERECTRWPAHPECGCRGLSPGDATPTGREIGSFDEPTATPSTQQPRTSRDAHAHV